jgi:hypothetical protein
VFERDGGRCVECRSNFDLQYDHILPVALGGATTIENLKLLCEDCNPVDPFYLSWRAREFDMTTEFIELAGFASDRVELRLDREKRRRLCVGSRSCEMCKSFLTPRGAAP